MRRKLLRIGIFLGCAALLVAGLGFRYSVMDGVLVMPVREAIWFYKGLLLVNSNYGPAWNGLGVTHAAAYALDVDVVEIPLDEDRHNTRNWLQPTGLSAPQMTYALRRPPLGKERALHLAQAARAFRAATHLGGDVRDTGALGLGYALYEWQRNFVHDPWPLYGDPFDGEARQHTGDSRWWEDQALAALREVPKHDLSYLEFTHFIGTAESAAAQMSIHNILSNREVLTDAELEELISFREERFDSGLWWEFSGHATQGLPPQPAEMEALYPVTPEGLETANLYLRAVDARFKKSVAYKELPFVGHDSTPFAGRAFSFYERCRIAQYLNRNAKAFQWVREASTSRVCRYPLDFSRREKSLPSHVDDLWQLSRSLALKAVYEADGGDSEEAQATLLDCFALVESIRNEPFDVSQYRRRSMLRTALETLEDVQARVDFSDVQLAELQSRLRALAVYEPAINGYRGSLVTLQRSIDEAQSKDSFGEPEYSDLLRELGTPSVEAYWSVGEALIDAIPRPFPEALAEFERVSAANRDVQWSWPSRIISIVQTEASLRNAQIGLAVDRYVLTYAGLPDSLDALVPDYLDRVPLDPFDGQPLRYRRVGEGFVVYSVGKNLVDDGGVRKVKSGEYHVLETADELYCVRVPEADVAGMTEEELEALREKPAVRSSVPQRANRSQPGEASPQRGGALRSLGTAEDTGAGRRPAPSKAIAE